MSEKRAATGLVSQRRTGEYTELRWTAERAERFWNFESRYPERYFTYRTGEEMIRLLQAYLPDNQPVLDFGCGAGRRRSRECR